MIDLAAKGEEGAERGPQDGESDGEIDRQARWIHGVRERLAAWYPGARRDLPWRTDRDAYRILVSELMLVQTTVAAVIPYFERFLSRFPNLAVLAAADESDVLKAWEGLGYYRRARQLHSAARPIVPRARRHHSQRPHRRTGVAGRGPLHRGGHPVVRFRPARADRRGQQSASPGEAAGAAAESQDGVDASNGSGRPPSGLVPARGAGAFNQALIGAGSPGLHAEGARVSGLPVVETLRGPPPRAPGPFAGNDPKPPPSAVTEAGVVIVVRKGRVLIVQRGLGGLWEQFWEFPTVHLAGVDPAGRPATSPAVDLAEESSTRLTGVSCSNRTRRSRPSATASPTTGRADRPPRQALSATPQPGPSLVDARWVEPGRARAIHLQLGRPPADRLDQPGL